MYNNESYEQFNKGKSIFFKICLIFIIVCIVLIIILTGYKQETFVCLKQTNICYIEKTNLVNLKNRHTVTKYSDIKNFSYKRRKIRGNRVSNGYISYYLIFTDKNNVQKNVFDAKYFDKKEVESAVFELKKQFKNNDSIILDRY